MKKRKTKKIFISFIVIILLWIIVFYFYNIYDKKEVKSAENENVLSTFEAQSVDNIKENDRKITDVIEDTTYKIVGISKLKNLGNSIFSKSAESELGLGTGFIVTDNGYILSNEHVTGEKFSKCYITLENGNSYEGTVVWEDKDLDLSIVKIDAKNLPYVRLGNSNKIKVGETVYAIGNPIGYEFRRTVTSGIISAKNRTIKIEDKERNAYMTDLIQTDATINPGNSGGPLISPDGEVIGVNTVKISSAEGIGFAVPINIIKPIIESFKNTGEFKEPTIGIFAYDKEVVPYLSKKDKFNKGIYVVQIINGGPAEKTELREGDIITKIDNMEVNTMNELKEYIYRKQCGEEVKLEVVKGKISKEIKIILREKQKKLT